MTRNGRIRLVVILGILLSVLVVLLASPNLVLGKTSAVSSDDLILAKSDVASLPQTIVKDAEQTAWGLFGNRQPTQDEFARQLLASYLAVKDKEVVIFFNPGGWGEKSLEDSPCWSSIATGIQNELRSAESNLLLLEYHRSVKNLTSYIDEFMMMIDLSLQKAEELACRIDFLTRQLPELKVMVAGENNGTIICDKVIGLLKDKPAVYSLQTGTPFWYHAAGRPRTLIINNNGITPDAFSNGDFFAIISTNLEALLGFAKPKDDIGKIMNLLFAPGHNHSWEDAVVKGQIKDFLNYNFK